jgi:very-short-patch-repair endonuclease
MSPELWYQLSMALRVNGDRAAGSLPRTGEDRWGTRVERTHRSREQTARARDLRRQASRIERRLWPRLSRSQAGAPFRRQHPVGPYFADYMCVPLKLAVEVGGWLHDATRDALRDLYMHERGITVLRFSTQDVEENLDGVVERIREEIWLLTTGAQRS